MIPADLVTHTAQVYRQGSRTSAAGDSVRDGDYDPITGAEYPCIAEQVGGGADAVVQRDRTRQTWHVSLNLGADVAVRDRLDLTDVDDSTVHTVTVMEIRRFTRPVAVSHLWLRCEEVTG